MSSFTFWLMLLPFFRCLVNGQGSVQLFSGSTCNSPSGLPISLGSDCLEAHQAGGVLLLSLPSCSGSVYLKISDMMNCVRPSISPSITSSDIGSCLFFPSGNAIGSAWFVCEAETDASSSAATETSSNAAETTTSFLRTQPSTLETSSAFSTPTTSTGPGSFTTINSDSSSVSSSSTTTATTSAVTPWTSAQDDSSSQSNKIDLGLGLGLGLPSLIIAFLTWKNNWIAKLKGKHVYIHSDGRPPDYDYGSYWC